MESKIISINKKINFEEKEVINHLENMFNKEDFYFSIKDEKISFHLKSLDFNKFKLEIKKKLNGTFEKSLFFNLVKDIENIKSYGLKGNKREYIDYNKERKVKERKVKEEKRGQFFYAQNNSFSKKNNILNEEKINRIITGDSEEELKKLPDNSIDLIFTSPPYNFGLDYENEKNDSDKWEEYIDKICSIFNECIRVVKYGGRIIINVQPLFSDYIPIHHIITNFFINKKMIWRGEILWEKNNYNCKYTAWGSWKSPSNPYMKYTWEFLEVFCKGTLKKERENKNIDILGDEFKKWVYAKWSIAPERKMKDFGHPAMFPEKLVERVLKLFSFENDIILDPFNGVGTTTKVAKELNRNYIGIDISEEYNKKAKDRIKELDKIKNLKTFIK